MENIILAAIAVISAVASIVNTIIQSRKVNSEKNEIEANITKKLQEVYNGIISAMQERITALEKLYNSNHCENAPTCKNRKK